METRRLGWIALALVGVSVFLIVPVAPAIILALWAAGFGRRLHAPLTRVLGGRPRLAAVFTVTALLAVIVPFAIVLASVADDAYDLVVRLMRSAKGKELLAGLVANDDAKSDPWQMLMSQKAQAWSVVQRIAGTAMTTAVGIFVFIAGMYGALVQGGRWYAWVRRHAPLAPKTVDRFAAAFHETGRGLVVGIGGAGLAQAIVATIAFVVLGVPHAFALGLLTLIGSMLPAIGSALVWVPVAIGLAVTGRTTEAIILGVVGVAVIGSIDNLVRPILARRGSLALPSFVVLVAMFGGVATIGGWGLLFAPLAVRLAKEALELYRESRIATLSTTNPGSGGDEVLRPIDRDLGE